MIPSDRDVGARGAVLVAAEALNQPFDAELWASSSRTVTAVSENVEIYRGGYADYQASLTAARGWWRL